MDTSAMCNARGNETGCPTPILDVGSLVGETERNIRQALQIADAMAPAVTMIDEVEKALSGVANSGKTDSGVSARLFGTVQRRDLTDSLSRCRRRAVCRPDD